MAARLPDRMRVMQIDFEPRISPALLTGGGTMERMADRYIEVSLVKRGITATAKLLDDRAPDHLRGRLGRSPAGW